MKVVLLGTGAADGWPSPFCRCESCCDAATYGPIRGQTAALVDDVLMLDCGPEAPRAAVRLGHTLADVRHILLTHAHPDHLGPQALLFRSWVESGHELEVIGPADAVDSCRPWVGPGDPVRFTTVRAGDRISAGPYDVTVLPAHHQVFRPGDAVLYGITAADGARMLWACDTGPWPHSWFEAVRGAGYDTVFLEETFGDRSALSDEHLGLPEFAALLDGLREVAAVTTETDVVAVHLGHHNPSNAELERRLAASGARAGRDGEVVHVGRSRSSDDASNSHPSGSTPGLANQPTRRRDRHDGDHLRVEGERRLPRKGHRTLVLGGVRSGKSSHAENLLAPYDSVTYIATGGTREDDAEWVQRVAAHRARRPTGWTTIETCDVATELTNATEPVLVDCLGTWLTARLDSHSVWESRDLDSIHADIDELIAAWRTCTVPVVAVSNEVGSGVVPASASGRLFRDLLGTLNTRVAAASEEVALLVAGLPVRLSPVAADLAVL